MLKRARCSLLSEARQYNHTTVQASFLYVRSAEVTGASFLFRVVAMDVVFPPKVPGCSMDVLCELDAGSKMAAVHSIGVARLSHINRSTANTPKKFLASGFTSALRRISMDLL